MECGKYRIPVGSKIYDDAARTKYLMTTQVEQTFEGCATGYGSFWFGADGGNVPVVRFDVDGITFYALGYPVQKEPQRHWWQIGDNPIFKGKGLGLDAPNWLRNLLKWRLVLLAVVLWALFRKKK